MVQNKSSHNPSHNPFVQGSPEELCDLLLKMMPKDDIVEFWHHPAHESLRQCIVGIPKKTRLQKLRDALARMNPFRRRRPPFLK